MKCLIVSLCLAAQLTASSPASAALVPERARELCQSLWQLPFVPTISVFAVGYFLFSTAEWTHMTNDPPDQNPLPLSQIQLRKGEMKTAKEETVNAGWFGYYGHGLMVGQPSSRRPEHHFIVLTSLELKLLQGAYEGDNYFGELKPLSTTLPEVYEKWGKLDKSRTYVIEYIRKNELLNYELAEEHTQVVGIYTSEEFLASRGVRSLPEGVRRPDPDWGWRTRGKKDATLNGRIVNVMIYGIVDSFCRVDINGGTKQSSESMQAGVHSFNIGNQELCDFAQLAMAYGQNVQVEFVEQVLEWWEPSHYYINSITIQKDEKKETAEGPTAKTPEKTPEEIAQETEQLLLINPAFFDKVVARMMNDPKYADHIVRVILNNPGLAEKVGDALLSNPATAERMKAAILSDSNFTAQIAEQVLRLLKLPPAPSSEVDARPK